MKSRESRLQYWQNHLQAFYTSGLSQREYCRRENISYWSFNPWKRRLEREDQSTSMTEIKFNPVKHEIASGNAIIMTLNNSVQISFPVDIPPDNLIYIINALGNNSCR